MCCVMDGRTGVVFEDEVSGQRTSGQSGLLSEIFFHTSVDKSWRITWKEEILEVQLSLFDHVLGSVN